MPDAQQVFNVTGRPTRASIDLAKQRARATTPHLPMTKTWMEGDFSIQSVAKESGWHLGTEGSRRLFAARLIHRYAYVVGTQKAFYWSLKNPTNVKEALQGLRQVSTPDILASWRPGVLASRNTILTHLALWHHFPLPPLAIRLAQLSVTAQRPALICLNDDLEKGAKGRHAVQKMLHDWFEQTFPKPLLEEANPRHR